MAPQVINATIASFNRDLCPYMAPKNDTKGCQKNVTMLWESMAKLTFSNTHLVPIRTCQAMNHCMNATKTIWPALHPLPTARYVSIVAEI